MYASVVVLTYQGPDIGAFTYKIPEALRDKIKNGQLVSVPFGKRNPIGIVLSTSREISNFKFQISNFKKISSIILPAPILLPYQIEFLKWLATYYHAPMVNCLKAILPELSTKVESLMTNVTAKNSLSRSSLDVQQTLVLVPSVNRLPETLAKFPSAKNYVIYHNELKTSEKFAAWLKIISGNVDFVFGSRSAIFTPCPNLTKIIIFDEHDGTYKDERSPYFDTLSCAEKIGKLTGAKIQIIDSSPKITTYFTHKNELEISNLPKSTGKIVSMSRERLFGNKSPISDLLAVLIKKTYAANGKILLFLNKKKESGQIYCKTCHFQDFTSKALEFCPNCKSPDIWFNSLNIASLATIVKGLIPKANINLISETTRAPYYPITLLPAIDIATSSIFYAPHYQKYDLVTHILADSLINIADFSSAEKLLAQITNLKKQVAKNGEFILQTFNPDHPIIKNAAQGNYLNFFRQQLPERKTLSYPPFALLVKLAIRGKNREKIAADAEKITSQLKSAASSPVQILGPYQSIFEKQIPSYNIILKYRLTDYDLTTRQKAVENLSQLFKQVPKGWQITIEPASIN